MGQRVRIVGCEPDSQIGPTLIGLEAVVDEVFCINYRGEAMVGVTVANRSDACFRPEHLEPLTPPKQQEVVTWDAACFTRDGTYKEPAHV